MTCRHCHFSAPPAYWIVRDGDLFCPDCGTPEWNDPRDQALEQLAKEGAEEAEADLFHERKH